MNSKAKRTGNCPLFFCFALEFFCPLDVPSYAFGANKIPSYTFLVCLIASHKQKARELEKVKRNFEKALTESVNTKSTTDEGGVRYSFGVTQNDINEYVDNAYKKENTEDYKKYAVASEKLISDVSDEIDLNGYSHALRDNDIRHIKNSHGEATNEKYPITSEDIKQIPMIVEHYDKVFVVKRTSGKTGIIYVKASQEGLVYYLEQVTSIYGNEPLLVNKQMIKTGINDIPGLPGLKDAIIKKQSVIEFLDDLKKAPKVYAQSVYQSHSINSISNSADNVKQKDIFGFKINENAAVDEDLLEELSIYHPDAEVDSEGNITVYHRTSKANAEKIRKTGIMTALEDALFFSSKSEGYASDYGDTVISFKMPSTMLRVNDIFDGEVHFDVPLRRVNNQWAMNVSKYLIDENTSVSKRDLSLSTSKSKPFVPFTADDVSGKDFVVQKPLAPIKKATEQKAEAPGIAPIKNTGKKFTTLDIVDDDAEVKSEDEKVKSEDVSSVSVTLDEKSLDNVAKLVRKAFSLTPAEKKTAKEIIQKYAESGSRDTEQLFNELKDNFAERTYKERVDEIADVKHALKGFKIFVPQNIKNGITDYSDFRRRNFGKLTISNEGSNVDNVYEALSYSFPNFFPSDVENDIDRLLQMSEVAGMETYKDGVDFLSDESITETAELIDDVVNTYKEKSFAEEAERERKESERKAERERKKLLIKKNMSNEERTELLKLKKIENVAVVNNAFPTPNIENFKWEDIDKVAGKEKRNIINKLAKEFGAFKEYTNKDIELTFNFSNNNFRESYGKQKKNFQTFAKMFSVFDKVIESAVGIEVHNRNKEGYKPDETLKNVYVLLSAFEDGENIIPVKLEIKEFNDKDNTLYVAVALETIKKTEVSKQGNAENGEAQNSRSVNISISDSAKNVNRHPNLLTISLNSSLPLNSSDKG